MKIIKTYSPSFVWALNAIISLFLMPRKFQSFTTNQNIDCFVIVKNFRSNFMSSHPGQHTAAQRLQELCFPERNLRYKSLNIPATSTTLYSIYSAVYHQPSKTAHEFIIVFKKNEAHNYVFQAYSSQISGSNTLP